MPPTKTPSKKTAKNKKPTGKNVKKPVKKASPKKVLPKKKPAPSKKALQKPSTKKSQPKASQPPQPPAPLGAISISEIEIIRRDTDKYVSGRRVQAIEVSNTKALVSPLTLAELRSNLVGADINSVSRYGMTIILEFAKGAGSLGIELGNGGQLRRHTEKAPKDKANVMVLTFTKGGQLRVNSHLDDTRIQLYTSERPLKPSETGLDLIDPIPKELFVAHIRNQPPEKTIKEVLTDSNFLIGLGDIYSDEILYKCDLKYDRPVGDIPDIKLVLMVRNLRELLYEVIKHRGTTLPSGYFCDLEGYSGMYQEQLEVYGRDGELTSSLHEVEKDKFKGRYTYFCRAVQH